MDKSQISEINIKWSGLILSRFKQNGVRHIVISPGSRSTPLVLAAGLLKGFEIHTIIDERSAGFFALGLAKATGTPPILLCTSGTAPAHYYPAVIEASMTNTPLIVMSADRPPSLRNVFASQSINQIKLFGDYPIAFKDVVHKYVNESDLDLTLDLADNFYCTATFKRGPVHLNVPFDKPFEPENEQITISILSQCESFCNDYPKKRTRGIVDQNSSNAWITSLVNRINRSKCPIIISGPSTIRDGSEEKLLNCLLTNTSIPVFAESVSGVRSHSKTNIIRNFESLVRFSEYSISKPDFIIRIGLPPVSKGLNTFLKSNSDVEQWCLSHQHTKPDPNNSASTFLQLPYYIDEDEFIGFEIISEHSIYLEELKDAESSCTQKIESLFQNKENIITDGFVSNYIGKTLNKDWSLFISNSLPVRDIDLFTTSFNFGNVWHNRGASGIDGITSTAHGIATATNSPLVLLTGDLTFLHDTNGLLNLAKHSGLKILIFITNNAGGNIFRMLPISNYESVYKPYFETPQQVDIHKLCEAYGLSAVDVLTPDELKIETENFLQSDKSVQIINCITDSEKSMKQRAEIWNIFQK